MTSEEENAIDAARDIAWKHFDLHAKQRIEVFKSYITLIAVIFAGYGIAFQAKIYVLGITIAFFSVLISILFWFLDQRTRKLIKLSEGYLKVEETRLAEVLHTKSITLFAESDRLSEASGQKTRKISYTRIFADFFLINIILALMLMATFIKLAVS